MSHAPFSLLLPVYRNDDATHFWQALLSSTVEQNLGPQQVVIVQDGPVGDDIAAMITRARTELPMAVDVVVNERNLGLAEALNRGLEACRFDVVARMDADDISLPRRFSRQWLLIEKGYDLVGTGMIEFDDDHTVTGARRVPPVGAERIRAHARTHNPVNHPTMMYRKSAVLGVGGYEPFGSMEDYWLVVRMLQRGARLENIADPLVAYRVGGVYERRGGVEQAKTELALQRKLLEIGFISRFEYVRNVVMKGVYRLLPPGVKRVLFTRFIGGGLRGDRSGRN